MDLARWLEPPPGMEARDRRSYWVMLFGNVVGLTNHFAFLVMFALCGVWWLAAFNVLSVALFSFNLVAQKRWGKTLLSMATASSEVILHQIVAVVILGWGYGFQYYLILVPALVFLGHFERRSIPLGISAASVGTLAWLWLWGQDLVAAHATMPEPLPAVLYGMNLLSTALVVAVFSFTYDRASRLNEDALTTASIAAEAANRAKSDFLANMSHELRTPLNAIIGYSEMMAEDNPDEQVAADLDKIRSSGKHLLGLINDILDLSKIEAGRLETVAEPFDVHALVATIDEMFSPMVVDKPVELVVAVEPEVPHALLGDPLRLRQVITNLVGNAVKFTEKGRVSVDVRAHARSGNATVVEVAVEDTGVGIEPERLEKVFEPFTSADAAVQRKFGGTGLGLSISRRLVELMGGEFEATSQPGVGSRFTFRLALLRPG